ncbi:MAG: alpha/beta hydrolase [Pseudomonadota bacterium]
MTRITAPDPAVYSDAAIAPETRANIEFVEKTLTELPSAWEFEPAVLRQLRREGVGILPNEPASAIAEWQEVKGLDGNTVPVRIFAPNGRGGAHNGVYLHIHGGGWTLGSADAHDQSLEKLARTLSIAVVSIEYRLAPEHPYPAGPNDCEAAALWLIENGAKDFRTDAYAIGGESAGGHLSAVTLLRLRNKHKITPFRAANFVYGGFDMQQTPSQRNWGDRNLILNDRMLTWFADHFLPPADFPFEKRGAPDISPLNARLHDMPPALFTVGTMDPLLDDSLFMAERWAAAGNTAELAVYPGGIHAFDAFDFPLAHEARAKMTAFLGGVFS